MEFILLSLCWRQIIVPLMQGFWHWNHENGIEWSNVPHLLSDVILFADNEEGFPSFCVLLIVLLSNTQSSATVKILKSRSSSAFCPLMYLRFGWKSFSFNIKYGLDPAPLPPPLWFRWLFSFHCFLPLMIHEYMNKRSHLACCSAACCCIHYA